MTGYYFQPPGQLSRRGVLDVGRKCPYSCQHCFYREPEKAPDDFKTMRHEKWRLADQLIQQLTKMKENGFVATDITGGEPILHPHIVELVEHCTSLKLASRIITLGQTLFRETAGKPLIHRLLDAGLTDFRFSYHASDEAIFRKMTGGDVNQMKAAMGYLDADDFQYYTNTVVTEKNYRHLPTLAMDMAKRRIYGATFLNILSHYGHAGTADGGELRVPYSEAAPYLRTAVDILESAGIAVAVRYAPMCTMAGIERTVVGQVGVRYDPHEWMNCADHCGPGDSEQEAQWLPERQGLPASHAQLLASAKDQPPFGRGTLSGPSKFFPKACDPCSAKTVCDGVDQIYLDAHGDGEFVPYCNVNLGEPLHFDRLRYFAGHIVKLEPDGDPKGAVHRLLHPMPVKENPLVSVVVANYNHADTLERCILSIEDQTYLNVEIIVVDDASTDASVSTLIAMHHEGETRCELIKRAVNAGRPSVPRNEGIRRSEGDLVMILDPDDWLSPTYIEECVNEFRKHPEASIIYTGIQAVGEDGTQQWVCVPFDPSRELTHNFIGCMSMYRREMWVEIGGYDEDEGLKGIEDYAFWAKAVCAGYIASPLPRQLAFYTRSSTGLFETVTKPNFDAKMKLIRSKLEASYPVELRVCLP